MGLCDILGHSISKIKYLEVKFPIHNRTKDLKKIEKISFFPFLTRLSKSYEMDRNDQPSSLYKIDPHDIIIIKIYGMDSYILSINLYQI